MGTLIPHKSHKPVIFLVGAKGDFYNIGNQCNYANMGDRLHEVFSNQPTAFTK